jgi:hypothetical protein
VATRPITTAKAMTGKTIPAMGAAFVALFCLGFFSCNSSSREARAAAVQFAYSWEQTIRVLGLLDLSDLKAVEAQSRNLEAARTALRTAGSEAMRKEADQLDNLILYVARSLEENIRVNSARPESDAARAPIPVDFSNPSFNKLLGVEQKEGDDNPPKALAGLHQAIVRFAENTGVGKEFKEALEERKQADAAQGGGGPVTTELGWVEIRDEKVRATRKKNASLASQRDKVEKDAAAASAPVGFAGAKWLMHADEVRRIRPNTTTDADGDLVESMEWLGRPARVWYNFSNDFLVMVSVSFGRATEADYATTQGFLQGIYGRMPEADKTERYLLSSHYTTGLTSGHIVRFSISHVLGTPPSSVEVVVYSREDF